MFSRSFSLPLKVCALLVLPVLVATGALLSGPAGFRHEPQSAEATNLSEIKKLTASAAGAGDQFGFSMAVSGNTAVVGAVFEVAGGSVAGAAYVFQRDEGGAANWGEVKKLTASDAQAGDEFGVSVAVGGDTAIIGAPLDDAGGIEAGAAYDFALLLPKPAPSFTPTATITPIPTVPPPVGGISLDSDLRALPLETASPDSSPWGVVVGTVAVACLVAVGGAAWYARRHGGGEGARWR